MKFARRPLAGRSHRATIPVVSDDVVRQVAATLDRCRSADAGERDAVGAAVAAASTADSALADLLDRPHSHEARRLSIVGAGELLAAVAAMSDRGAPRRTRRA